MSAYLVTPFHIDLLTFAAIIVDRDRDFGGFRWGPIREYQLARRASNDEHEPDYTGDHVETLYSPSAFATMLLRANITSLDTRYGAGTGLGDSDGSDTHTYAHPQLFDGDVTAPLVFRAIHCFEYQACEFDGWDDSIARHAMTALQDAWVRRVDGYEEAPWGLTDRGDVLQFNANNMTGSTR